MWVFCSTIEYSIRVINYVQNLLFTTQMHWSYARTLLYYPLFINQGMNHTSWHSDTIIALFSMFTPLKKDSILRSITKRKTRTLFHIRICLSLAYKVCVVFFQCLIFRPRFCLSLLFMLIARILLLKTHVNLSFFSSVL